MAPTVLWIDEIEKGMAPGGGQDSDGGLSRRLFGSFLTWMQEKRAEVFVVATANDLSALPPELLRKGRFDEIFDLARLAAASSGFSGAELEQAVISALLQALQEGRTLDTDLVERELSATVPLSVSRAEDVERLRAFARERFAAPVR